MGDGAIIPLIMVDGLRYLVIDIEGVERHRPGEDDWITSEMVLAASHSLEVVSEHA
jgi:hypothetical protein